jgi:hypothetical protein
MSIDKNFCAAAFVHVCVDADPVDKFKPCCVWDPIHDHSAMGRSDDPFNSEFMQQIRQDMLAGKQIPGCKKCHDREAANTTSPRLRYNQEFGYMTEPKLLSLEFNLGNLCNMKCRMCSSISSSRWIQDDTSKKNPGLVRRRAADLKFDYLDIVDLKLIGGEPTLEQDQIRVILGDISNKHSGLGHLGVQIATNGTAMFDDDIMQQLMTCRKVSMEVSMDGIGPINDYQRVGGDWNTVADVAKRYDSLSNGKFGLGIVTTVSLLTIDGITDLADWVRKELPNAWHETIPIDYPRSLNIANLPTAVKSDITDKIKAWIPYNPNHKTEQIRRRMLSRLSVEPVSSIEEVRAYLLRLDGIMQDSIWDVAPELAENIFK